VFGSSKPLQRDRTWLAPLCLCFLQASQVLLAACASSPALLPPTRSPEQVSATRPRPIEPPVNRLERTGSYRVDSANFTFVDTSRPTPPNRDFKGDSRRTLKARIWYPAREGFSLRARPRPVARGGPYPLIAYSHGFHSSRGEATQMAEHFASHGFITIAADFPLSNWRPPGGKPTLDDLQNQPRDISFLIDRILEKSQTPGDLFHGAVDADRIGAAGISMGGMTTLLTSYHRTLHDPRIRAALSIAGPISMFGPDFFSRDIPLLQVHGDRDAIVYYEVNARPVLTRAAGRAHLLTIEGASHTGFAHIPMEWFALNIVGAWVAPKGSHRRHTDRLGCGFIADVLPDDARFLDALGGVENGMLAPDDTAPCSLSVLSKPALKPGKQRRIAIVAGLAFFQAQFGATAGARNQAQQLLAQELPARQGIRYE
jgi:predicted dienelactone hydrolase